MKLKTKQVKRGAAIGVALIFFIAVAALYQVQRSPRLPVPVTDDATTFGAAPSSLPTADLPAAQSGQPIPTNRWWSPGITSPWPSPLYAWPLAVRLEQTGATIAQPQRKVAQRTVMAEWSDPLRLSTPGNIPSRSIATAWGDWDVTFETQAANGQPVYSVTLAEGSPFAFFQSFSSDLSINLPPLAAAKTLKCGNGCGSAITIETPAQQRYLLLVDEQTDLTVPALDRIDLHFPSGAGAFTLAALAPNSNPEKYIALALRPVKNTRAEYALSARTIQTTFSFNTRTLFGVMPHQALHLAETPGQPLGSFETLRGIITLYEGESFTTTLPRPALLPAVPPALPEAEMLTWLAQDIEAETSKTGAADVYGAGKDLLRQAQLAELAHTQSAEQRTAILQLAQETWRDWCTHDPQTTDPNYFSYDPQLGGLLASKHAFGSEHYNDHHFHYGYFIHAASILARLNPAIADELKDCVSLLIDDIAADRNNSSFPYLRYFDPYAGHSWAHGLTPVGDGNNQESTSEAIHAWYAIALWGKTVADKGIEERGLWLMSQEMAGARVYWFNANPEFSILPADFPFPMISILWGGKLDYATFFSASPAAIHGIQFFPATPALFEYIDVNIVNRLIRPVQQAGQDSLWLNSLNLAGAPYGTDSQPIREKMLDPVYSPSFAQHWLATWTRYGQPALEWQPQASCGRVFIKNDIGTAAMYRFPSDSARCIFTHAATGQSVNFADLAPGWNIRLLTADSAVMSEVQ